MPATPLTLWPAPAEGGADSQREQLALAAAAQIERLLDADIARIGDEPVKPRQIAVLVNKHRESDLVLRALRQRHIAAVCVQKQSVFGTGEATDALRLLDALLAPESIRLARAALVTPLLGLTLSGLRAMHEDAERAQAPLEQLADWRRLWMTRGVLAMLEAVTEARAPELLAGADGQRRLANLMQLGELLQEAAHGQSGPRALRDWLARRVRDPDDNREEEQLGLESDAECVQIMTLHASKGLEFDLVLMPFLGLHGVNKAGRGELARFHRGDEAVRRLIQSASGDRGEGDAEALAMAHRERLAEDVRLAYVGVTRARHACWFSVDSLESQVSIAPGTDLPGKVVHWLLPQAPDGSVLAARHPQLVASAPLPDCAARTPPAANAARPGPARRFERELERDWWVHSFSQLNRGEREPEIDAPADHEDPASPGSLDSGEPDVPTWPRGSAYGDAVHGILEHADFERWRGAAPVGEPETVARQLLQAGLTGAELERAVDATTRLIAASMNAPCIDDVPLAAIPPGRRRAEMRFHFGIAGADPDALLALLHAHGYQRERSHFRQLHGQLRGLMHGIIDLVVQHEGRWWVIDYKTNHLGERHADYAGEGLRRAIAEHGYDLQYLIYTVAVHRWLRQLLGRSYDYERDFGGVRYLFLRGMRAEWPDCGIHADRPPVQLIEQLDAMLAAPGREAA